MKFSVITPCYNAERFIGETIDSIFQQTALKSGRATLQYLVIDGQSKDQTAQVVRDRIANFTHGEAEIISEPDHGMYDALSKGLQRATGDICAYLNAGDLYNPHAFDVILDVVSSHPTIQWLTGMQVHYNERAEIIYCKLPFRYRRRLFSRGMYDGQHLYYLQQESTFWRHELLQNVDFDWLRQFKYAGDFYLWHCFAKYADLKIVETHLGGFRVHKGQLSENLQTYNDEIRSIAQSPTLMDRLLAVADTFLNLAPGRIWHWFNHGAILSYDTECECWR